MLDASAAVALVEQSRGKESPSMLSNRLLIRMERRHDLFKCHSFSRFEREQNLNAVVIRHSLEMPLHLFCGLCLSRTHTEQYTPTATTYQHSQVCQYEICVVSHQVESLRRGKDVR